MSATALRPRPRLQRLISTKPPCNLPSKETWILHLFNLGVSPKINRVLRQVTFLALPPGVELHSNKHSTSTTPHGTFPITILSTMASQKNLDWLEPTIRPLPETVPPSKKHKNRSPTLVLIGSGPGIGVAVASFFAQRKFNTVVLIARDSKRLIWDQQAVLRACHGVGRKVDVRLVAADVVSEGFEKTLDGVAELLGGDFLCGL